MLARPDLRIVLAAAVLLAPALVVAADTLSPHQAVEQGNAAFAAGDAGAAGRFYEQAAAALPQSPLIQYNLGIVAVRGFDLDAAAARFQRALQSGDQRLESRVRYNLAVVHHRQALKALQTFQDALTPLEQAIGLYRDALRLDPAQADARYNLELAYRLLLEVERQQVQPQNNPRVRDQKPSPNEGQQSTSTGQASRRDRQEAGSEKDRKPQGAEAQQAPQGSPSRDDSSQVQDAASPRELSPEQAEELVTVLRNRARSLEAVRQQWRRARMQDGALERNW